MCIYIYTYIYTYVYMYIYIYIYIYIYNEKMQAAYGKFESKGTFRRFCFAFFCLVFAFLCAGASALRHEENVFVLLVWSFFCVCFLRF